MSISELLGALYDQYGSAPSYQRVWRRAHERRIPSRRDERGRPSFDPKDLPVIAVFFGLTSDRAE